MTERAHNFNPGPAALPLEVLKRAQEEFVNYQGIGMSVMEISHRSKEYEQINADAQKLFTELTGLTTDYKVLFLQGGASTQFAMVPLNFLSEGKTAQYIVNGSWGEKAVKDASAVGKTAVVGGEKPYVKTVDLSNIPLADDTAYVHITSNETIEGIQYDQFPDTGDVPLIADMSSDILCRPLDFSRFSLVYAGAQKNLGPSGVTVVVIREDMLERIQRDLPKMLRYDTHVKADSLYNTPPVFSVYMVKLVLEWLRDQGGLAAIERRNREKADLLYRVIDESDGFYRGTADPACRSLMNVTFRLRDEALEKQFLQQAADNGFVGLKGHRSVGGMRASIYNAVPLESCQALAQFMDDFYKKHG